MPANRTSPLKGNEKHISHCKFIWLSYLSLSGLLTVPYSGFQKILNEDIKAYRKNPSSNGAKQTFKTADLPVWQREMEAAADVFVVDEIEQAE